MSASEKLKALNGRFELLRVGDTPPPVLELLFWPQLVAVVEAAERVTRGDVGSLLHSSVAALRAEVEK